MTVTKFSLLVVLYLLHVPWLRSLLFNVFGVYHTRGMALKVVSERCIHFKYAAVIFFLVALMEIFQGKG